MLQINEYQKRAHESANYPIGAIGGKEDCHIVDYIYPVVKLAQEAGEVLSKFAKAIKEDEGIILTERRREIIKELGDVLWYVSEITTVLGDNLEHVMQANLDWLEEEKEKN